MKAAILAVGTELLGTDRLDTNSLEITAVLNGAGVELVGKAVVGDDEELIASALEGLCRQADLVVITGGLGPTQDDRSREGITLLTSAALELDSEALDAIVRRYQAVGRKMPEVNRRQAMVPRGATVLANDRGTAPGLQIRHAGTELFLFPGVPLELRGMLENHFEPWLRRRTVPNAVVEQVELRVACMAESWVEERLADAYLEFGGEVITVLASPGEIRVRLRAQGDEASRSARLAEMTSRVSELVGAPVFTVDGEELEQVVAQSLEQRGLTLSVAESCTGGLIGGRLTAVPGSSSFFAGGAISYSDELKIELLGVDPKLIEEHGAVSSEVAAAMATGGRSRFGTDLALSVTGVAGPGGGTLSKPVGTVHFGVAGGGPDGIEVITQRALFPGDRATIRGQASQFGLEMVRRLVLGLESEIQRGLLTERRSSIGASTGGGT